MYIFIYFSVFLLSSILTFLLIRFKNFRYFHDYKSGPQKFHEGDIPRVGGLAVFFSFFIGSIIFYTLSKNIMYVYINLTSTFVFIGGFLEDLTKRISSKYRFLFIIISAIITIYLFKIVINRLGIPLIDNILSIEIVAVIFTIFALVGITNAINIIDGFNGLASGVSILIFLSLAYVGYTLGDLFVINISLLGIFSTLGFFVFNYPKGKIFLGDGGAYFLGFLIGVLLVYLPYYYKVVSPWYSFSVVIYPVFETLFSLYRRAFIKKTSPTSPDATHLHTLIFRRLLKSIENKKNRNPLTSLILWIFSGVFIFLSTIFYQSSILLILLSLCFIVLYIIFYRAIIKFRLS